MAVAWSWAFDTPFKWTKQVASHFGGTRQGLAISWPAHIKDAGGIRTQFHHIIDIVPTILEATGIKAPETGQRHQAKADRRREHGVHVRQGERQRALDPQDPVFRDGRQPRDLSRRLVRQHDAAGRAVGVERDRCRTSSDYKWELYNLERGLLAGQRPRGEDARQAEGNAGAVRAGGGEVQRLSAGQQRSSSARSRRGRAPTAGKTVFTYSGVNAGIPTGNAPNILNRSFTITAEVDVPEGGGDGMIVTEGGRFGGYGLYLLKGKPVFTYNLLKLLSARWERRRTAAHAGQAHDRVRLQI